MPTKAIDEKYLDFHIIGRFTYQGKEWLLTNFEDAVFHGMRIEPGGIDKTHATFNEISDLVTIHLSMPNWLTERVDGNSKN